MMHFNLIHLGYDNSFLKTNKLIYIQQVNDHRRYRPRVPSNALWVQDEVLRPVPLCRTIVGIPYSPETKYTYHG